MKKEFAQQLGFESYETLCEESEIFFEEPGDITWFITQLPDGRWASWDDAEISLDRVSFHDTREEAEAFQKEGLEA